LLDTGLKSLRDNAGAAAADNIFPGDKVLVAGRRTGTVHFVGNTEFAPGIISAVSLITVKLGVALTGRKCTGRRAVSAAHAPGGRPAVLQTTTDDDDRCQRAKQYWPIRWASNNM